MIMDNWYQHAVTKQSAEYGIIPQRQYDYMSSLVLLWNGLLISCLMVYSNENPCIIIWDTDLHTGERKQELKGGPHDVFSLRQLSNGPLASDLVTLLSYYGTPDKGECQKVLKGHTNDVISLDSWLYC